MRSAIREDTTVHEDTEENGDIWVWVLMGKNGYFTRPRPNYFNLMGIGLGWGHYSGSRVWAILAH